MDIRERVLKLLEAKYIISKLHFGYDVDILPTPDCDIILVRSSAFIEDEQIKDIVDTINGLGFSVDSWFVSADEDEDGFNEVRLYISLKGATQSDLFGGSR